MRAAQLMLTNGDAARGLWSWIRRTMNSFPVPLSPIEFLETRADSLAETLDLLPQIRRLEVGPDGVDLRSPAAGVASNP